MIPALTTAALAEGTVILAFLAALGVWMAVACGA